jgi:FkbM family methyltransferase
MEPASTAPSAKTRKRGYQLSLVELLAMCFIVAALTVTGYREWLRPHFYFSENPLIELKDLEKYGAKFSMGVEEWVARDYFQDRRDGVFLDVGANHHELKNNTYFLEKRLGWSGVAVDALAEFAEGYKTYRPRTKFVAMFASDVPDSRVQFFVPDNNLVASADPDFVKKYGNAGEAREVPSTTLTAVLDQAGIRKVDYMSMDIELAEPKALAGFDIDRFKPDLVCIEVHPKVRQQIIDYFAKHQYVLVGTFVRVDPHNLYFQPMR